MSDIFVWDPTADQIYDGTYTNSKLTQESTDDGYPVNSFYKVNADFDLSSPSGLKLYRDSNPLTGNDHIHWESNTSGNVINIINGHLFCIANSLAPSDPQENVTIFGTVENPLEINIDSQVNMINYSNILFECFNLNLRANGGYRTSKVRNIMFISESAESDINIRDTAGLALTAANSIIFSNCSINASSNTDGLLINAVSNISFFNYDVFGGASINISNNCQAEFNANIIEFNNAKFFFKDNANINIVTDLFTIKSGGGFNVSDNAILSINSTNSDGLNFNGITASSYPPKIFNFIVHGAIGDAEIIINGVDDGSGLKSILNYNLLSVNGNTDESFLRSVLNFDSTVINNYNYSNTYNQLKISIKKDAVINI